MVFSTGAQSIQRFAKLTVSPFHLHSTLCQTQVTKTTDELRAMIAKAVERGAKVFHWKPVAPGEKEKFNFHFEPNGGATRVTDESLVDVVDLNDERYKPPSAADDNDDDGYSDSDTESKGESVEDDQPSDIEDDAESDDEINDDPALENRAQLQLLLAQLEEVQDN